MNMYCCGKRVKSIDHVRPVQIPGVLHTCYETIRDMPGYASWRCDECGKVRVQKLRVPEKTA